MAPAPTPRPPQTRQLFTCVLALGVYILVWCVRTTDQPLNTLPLGADQTIQGVVMEEDFALTANPEGYLGDARGGSEHRRAADELNENNPHDGVDHHPDAELDFQNDDVLLDGDFDMESSKALATHRSALSRGMDILASADATSPWRGRFSPPPVFLGYAALLDERGVWSPGPVIIVLGRYEDKYKFRGNLTWAAWFPGAAGPENVTARVLEQPRFFLVRLTDGRVPDHVGVSLDNLASLLFTLPVEQPPRPAAMRDLNICQKITYSSSMTDARSRDDSRFVSWVELQRLLGVQHVSMYNSSMPPAWRRAAAYYVGLGVLDVTYSPPAHPRDPYYHQELINVHHCLHRTMFSYKNTMIVDLDEVILPTHADNYTQLLDIIAREYSADITRANMRFPNVYFFLDNPANHSSRADVMLRTRWRRDLEAETWTAFPKSIINPRLCKVATEHFCNRKADGAFDIHVDPRLAKVHHYRNCQQWNRGRDTCLEYFASATVRDDTILRFEDRLLRNVRFVREVLDGG